MTDTNFVGGVFVPADEIKKLLMQQDEVAVAAEFSKSTSNGIADAIRIMNKYLGFNPRGAQVPSVPKEKASAEITNKTPQSNVVVNAGSQYVTQILPQFKNLQEHLAIVRETELEAKLAEAQIGRSMLESEISSLTFAYDKLRRDFVARSKDYKDVCDELASVRAELAAARQDEIPQSHPNFAAQFRGGLGNAYDPV